VKNGDFYIGAQYMPMGKVDFGGSGRHASLDLSGQIYVWPASIAVLIKKIPTTGRECEGEFFGKLQALSSNIQRNSKLQIPNKMAAVDW